MPANSARSTALICAKGTAVSLTGEGGRREEENREETQRDREKSFLPVNGTLTRTQGRRFPLSCGSCSAQVKCRPEYLAPSHPPPNVQLISFLRHASSPLSNGMDILHRKMMETIVKLKGSPFLRMVRRGMTRSLPTNPTSLAGLATTANQGMSD